MQYNDVLHKLKALSNPGVAAEMARYGINSKNTLGVSMPDMRIIAGEAGRDHSLARQLWASGIREARLIAGMIDDPKMATEEQLESWVKDFDAWDVCDGTCMNLFGKTDFAYRKALEWSSREEEFVKRAGFVMMTRLVVSDKKADDSIFEQFLPIIVREARDDRNYVKKAVNWALRQIGKRSRYLNQKAVDTAKEIQRLDEKSARWIAADAIRELTNPKVLARMKR